METAWVSINEWTNRRWAAQTMEGCSALKKKAFWHGPHRGWTVKTWSEVKRCQTQKDRIVPLKWGSTECRQTHSHRTIVVTRAEGEWGRGLRDERGEFAFGKTSRFWRLMVAQQWKWASCHYLRHHRNGNWFFLCVFHQNGKKKKNGGHETKPPSRSGFVHALSPGGWASADWSFDLPTVVAHLFSLITRENTG